MYKAIASTTLYFSELQNMLPITGLNVRWCRHAHASGDVTAFDVLRQGLSDQMVGSSVCGGLGYKLYLVPYDVPWYCTVLYCMVIGYCIV
eukprot:scaffold40988_cov52-Attheya_sp.AAC.2